jgi:hypothetical protein
MPRGDIYELTEEEVELLRLGRENPDYITNYFFRPKGADQGWIFDYNFDPEGAWQRMVHHAEQRRIIVIGGFGSGKTRGVGISACTWAMTVPDFMFLNAAPKAWQSELMYKFIISVSRGTPFEKLIYAKPKRPYPLIELRFIVLGKLMVSTLEFMSVEKNSNTILGWEGDWANIDEAGQLDDLTEIIRNLGSRMRGSISGRDRLGRLSMVSNSWDNPDMWYRYDLASALPDDYLSFTVSSRHNHNITADQLRLMLKDIPEDEHDQFIEGARPEGKGLYFNKEKVYACEDDNYGNYIIEAIKAKLPGFEIQTAKLAGVVYFKTPAVAGHDYVVLGDPGTGEAPNRNAPALMVWDITNFPKFKAGLVAAWWGNGHNSITPFIRQLLQFMADFNPVKTAVDSTGPQKNSNELLNIFLIGSNQDPQKVMDWIGVDISHVLNPIILGMDFSGAKKPAYLVSGRMMIEAGLTYWPKFFVGLRSQLTNYDIEKDKSDATSKIAQDLVSTYCMSAYLIRDLFVQALADVLPQNKDEDADKANTVPARAQRLSGSGRTARGGRAVIREEAKIDQ